MSPLDIVGQAAERLHDAARSGVACAPVRDLIGTEDSALAYAVQQRLARARVAAGAQAVGRKIGLTSLAVQRQLGVDRPDFGLLFDDMNVTQLGEVATRRLLQPRVEVEIAFVLAADLTDGPLDSHQIRSAVDHAVAALEIVDSRIANWDITFSDTVADNAAAALFVLGERRVALDVFEPAQASMELHIDGDTVARGEGTACLGDPLLALAWLAHAARDSGAPLIAGEVVLSGSLGPMVPIGPGNRLHAEIEGLGAVSTVVV